MICVICILAGIAPGDVHFAGSQVDYQRVDGFLAVKRVKAFDIVIADRVRNINMILLNGLQTLDGM